MWARLARHPWVTSLVLVALITAGAAIRDVHRDAQQDAYAECVARWADDWTARAVELGAARSGVDAANDDLWRTLARLLVEPVPDARAELQRHLDQYVGASDTYRERVRVSPPPPPPRLGCGRADAGR